MADWLPRFADVKSVEDLSKLLAYPMVISAHVLQTGLTISQPELYLDFSIPSGATGTALLLWTLCIFVIKAFYASFCAIAAHFCIAGIEHFIRFPMHSFVAALLMALALSGVLGKDSSAVSALGLVPAWYYAAFVFGFYLLAWHKENPP
ncbi:hypothetical protein [Variovorax rhizosphaerae]|uniref:DoxX family protein n=1 Tax=Variovorax rhizosphaerae TaxID=1836200 RepID=A0ABU8WUM1_9BURK